MDSRQARSEATQQALMTTAVKLIADRGIENVSIRDIVSTAGQKNESALQYHFKNLKGLIGAIHASRAAEIQAKRAELLQHLGKRTVDPSLRDICKLMVEPAYLLAKSNTDFRRYVKAFGHEITLTDQSAVALVSNRGGQSAQQMSALLRAALSHLDDAALQRRMDGALRFVSASMVHQARQKNGFRGAQADLFFNSLIDALVGLLGAAESDETIAIANAIDHK